MATPPLVVMATEADMDAHLRVCANSDFRVNRSPDAETVMVLDEDALVLLALHVLGVWFVRLNPRYYRHPFQPAVKGTP